jgi:HlyD family secretion protein
MQEAGDGRKIAGSNQTTNDLTALDPGDRGPASRFERSPDSKREKAQVPPKTTRTAAVLVAIIVAAVFGLTLWYLVQPQPLLVQGEADATRIDIAARVEGRVARRPVERGDNVASGAILYEIANPELLTSLDQAKAAKGVAEAQLAHILAGTRA